MGHQLFRHSENLQSELTRGRNDDNAGAYSKKKKKKRGQAGRELSKNTTQTRPPF